MTATEALRSARLAAGQSVGVFLRDAGHGLLEISHNMLALLGLALVAATVFAAGRDDIRAQAEVLAFDWLQTRHEARTEDSAPQEVVPSEPDAVARATALDPKDLPRQQAAVAQWISRRYKVAPEPISRLVQEAWSVGQRTSLDPTLILAIMAVESSFNPFAQSAVGAQGLMQVMTRVHDDKYSAFGGNLAAFDPVTNLRVGVLVLKECISRAGGIEAGLRSYVGATGLETDGGYVGRVLQEQSHLRKVADGKGVPANASNLTPAPKPPVAADAAAVERVALLR